MKADLNTLPLGVFADDSTFLELLNRTKQTQHFPDTHYGAAGTRRYSYKSCSKTHRQSAFWSILRVLSVQTDPALTVERRKDST